MKKVIKNDKVAVLYSPEYGAGWFTWNDDNEELLFHPALVEMVADGDASEIDEQFVSKHLGIDNVYCGGASDLKIEWMPIGTRFMIDCYDGFESILLVDNLTLIA